MYNNIKSTINVNIVGIHLHYTPILLTYKEMIGIEVS